MSLKCQPLRLRFVGLLCMLACLLGLLACSARLGAPGAGRPTETPLPPLQITLVDNAGFLINCGGKKILVDGFIRSAPGDVRTRLEEAAAPFEAIDVILTTHSHSDHFNARMVGQYLERSPDTIFVSTMQAVDDVKKAVPAVQDEQLKPFEPKEGERLRASFEGIRLQMLNLPHGVPVTNLAFVIEVGGWKLLHTGDLVDVEDVKAYGLTAENIDVAFVPYFYLVEERFLSSDGKSPLLESIQAEHVVPMHLAVYAYDREATLQQVAAGCPDCLLFHEALETQTLDAQGIH
jgi:L-ascorbate metabolism protein UlaG (beta-lactamase superfamily)